MQPLRSLLSLVLSSACFSFVPAIAQDDLSSEPYTVYVAQGESYARCGPSGEHYRTDPLRHGQALEVYAETDDGWLGIRPPEDSFCWVIAETIDLDAGQGTGTVIEDRTVAWIGTHLGRARQYRWQVQLAKGEQVSVIGRSQREGPDGPQTWYRIVPPSGEFRWVHRDQVVATSEELVTSISREKDSSDTEFLPAGPTRQASQRRRTGARDVSVLQAGGETELDVNAVTASSSRRNAAAPRGQTDSETAAAAIGSGLKEDWQANRTRESFDDSQSYRSEPEVLSDAGTQGRLQASVEFLGRPRFSEIGAAAPNASETAGDSNWVAGVARSIARAVVPGGGSNNGAIAQVSAVEPITTPGGTLTPTVVPALRTLNVVSAEQVANVEAETRGADVDRLSLIFSRLMAARASGAECEPVSRAARQLAGSSADQVMAGRAKLLAERVEQYQRVAQRRDGEVTIQRTMSPQLPLEQTGPTGAIPQGSVSQSGYLVQVYSARANSPPFALTDNSGRTIAYITPSPGVNVRTFLNSHIKVTGQQGFVRGLNTPHILVSQAIPVAQ